MGELADQRLLLAAARADLIENADLALRGVPDRVAASWRRSVDQGVPPHEVAPPYSPELDFDARLVRCAQPVLDQLSKQIADLPISVALTDERARLVSRRDSNCWIARMLDRVYFAQGFDYAEGVVGTNGVGTVLEFGESMHVVGAEHFVESLQAFACAGAPVRDPFTGRIEGVLDLSCMSEHSTPLMHSLVRSAARQIERNLLTDRDQAQQALFDAYSRVEMRSRQAVLAVGRRTVLGNSPLRDLLDARDQEVLQDHVRFVMPRHATVDDEVELPSGTCVRLRGARVELGGDIAGMVAVVSAQPDLPRPTPVMIENGRPRSTTVDTPRHGMLESRSPAWRAAAATVETAIRAGTPVLVLGEPGTGRCTLLAEVHRLVSGSGQVIALTADEVAASPSQICARLREPASGPTLYVLRDIDRLPAKSLGRLADALGPAPDGAPGRVSGTVAAMASEAIVEHASYQRLLAAFGASAIVPALRHRRSDLPGLVEALLTDLAPHRDTCMSRDSMRVLGGYDWPGNVRQLKRVLSAALARRPVGVIEAADLPAFCQSVPRSSLRPVDETERDAIVTALRETGGNRVAATKALGIARSTLYRKIRQYGITI
ncbi:transcriptional activator of acetoin/glycerol metabolism [Saccharomonospora marina XMU15]|uniref:Transcriptional activator of acetoin/glycerol metabolism n=1 Tax=Saccharomonospora marina XMU15 TaxID=882083 RepID=H5X756_9PSEU|nr:transcriptional activator of acetoin/glycerol metabolism [Saccharomonospora marina XMU15]